MPKKPQNCPYTTAPKQYGAAAQTPLPTDISPKLSDVEIKKTNVLSVAFYTMRGRLTSPS